MFDFYLLYYFFVVGCSQRKFPSANSFFVTETSGKKKKDETKNEFYRKKLKYQKSEHKKLEIGK